DFLHGNRLDVVDARSVFQFYWLGRLWRDIETALGAGLTLVNFATEPVSVHEVARPAFGVDFRQETVGVPARYDFRTKHDRLYGGARGYLYTKEQVLSDMLAFVASQSGARRCA